MNTPNTSSVAREGARPSAIDEMASVQVRNISAIDAPTKRQKLGRIGSDLRAWPKYKIRRALSGIKRFGMVRSHYTVQVHTAGFARFVG